MFPHADQRHQRPFVRFTFLTLIALIALWSCRPDGAAPSDPALSVTGGGSDEEEIFGLLFDLSGAGMAATLTPRGDGVTGPNQPPYQATSVSAAGGHQNDGANYGWYGVSATGYYPECKPASDAENVPERHSPDIGEGKEHHCARSGRFTLQLPDVLVGEQVASREIDYVEYQGKVGLHNIESSQPVGTTDVTSDVIVHFDGTSNGTSATPVIEVDHPAQRDDGTWSGQPMNGNDTVSGLTTNWFRFGAWQSVSTWTEDARGAVLVRYFWDYDRNVSNRSGFVMTEDDGPGNIRVRRFTTPGLYHVIAQLAEPDEVGGAADGSWGATRSFYVKACDPSLSASFTWVPASPMVGQTVQFTAATGQGTDGCGSLEFRWLVNGIQALDWNPSPGFSRQFAAAQSYLVTLEKRSASGTPSVSSQTVVVNAPPPVFGSVSGPLTVRPRVNCEWVAGVQGGTPPFAYRWRRGGVVVGTQDIYVGNTGTMNFWLKLTVTDAAQQSDADSVYIGITTKAPACVL
jgi:hypothetical protein